jgi:hypothetical protein
MKLKIFIDEPKVEERNILARSGKEYTFYSQPVSKVEVYDDNNNLKSMQTDAILSLRKNNDGSYYPELLPAGEYISDDGHYIDNFNTIKRSTQPVFTPAKKAVKAA